jgi:hypothetical protein
VLAKDVLAQNLTTLARDLDEHDHDQLMLVGQFGCKHRQFSKFGLGGSL